MFPNLEEIQEKVISSMVNDTSNFAAIYAR